MADIAVAITTYNQARWIGEALQSVLDQSVSPREVVVIDDGSTDDTPAVLEPFRDRVRVIRQRNAGIAASRNAAVLACSAEYVALLDGDDVCHRDKLRRCAELLDTFGRPSFMAHDFERISPEGTVINRGEIAARLADWGHRDPIVLDCFEQLLHDNFISTTSQVVVRRDAYIACGLSDPAFTIGSDYDLYLRLAIREPFLLAGDVLAYWRRHGASASTDRHVDSALDMVSVLQKARATAEMAGHATAIDRRQHAIVRLVYSCEGHWGKWTTARALTRIAWRRRNLYSAFAASAVLLIPQRLRQAAASLTGVSVSTQPGH
jgi:glycosyltransferase involved in cell wall biosynthesis